MKKNQKLENHVIICGYGRKGKQIVQDENISLEEISYESLPSEFRNKSISELHITKRSVANIVGLKNKEGQYI